MKYKVFVFLVFSLLLRTSGSTAWAAEQLCEKFDAASVAGGVYKIQNNIWGADTHQCISALNDTGFIIDSSSHHNTGEAPASYPSIWRGCHWNDCTPNSNMPIQAGAVEDAVFRWQFEPISDGTWNAVAEAWFKTTSDPGPPDGAELMIWLNHRGNIRPGGSKVDTIDLAGTTWEVWFTDSRGWNFVTYRRATPVTSVTIDMKVFLDDAMARGYVDSDWYMMDLEAGFEVWQGGAGLQSDAFAFQVNGGPSDNHPPIAEIQATPTSGEIPLPVDFSAEGSSDADADTLTYTWDFGDGNGDTGTSVAHTYTSAGNYTATVTVSDGQSSATASIEIDAHSPGSDGVDCEYIVTHEWNAGFTANIRITNNGRTPVNGWEVSWEYTDGSGRAHGWNANVTGDNPYVATPLEWNRKIPPGKSVEFGMVGFKGTENDPAPTPNVTGDVCEGESAD